MNGTGVIPRNFTKYSSPVKANLRPIPIGYQKFSQTRNNGSLFYQGEWWLLGIIVIM